MLMPGQKNVGLAAYGKTDQQELIETYKAKDKPFSK
jgi:hypothetical protein